MIDLGYFDLSYRAICIQNAQKDVRKKLSNQNLCLKVCAKYCLSSYVIHESYKYSIQIEMENELQKQRAQQRINNQSEIERDTYFWQGGNFDIILTQMIQSQVPPFILTEDLIFTQEEHYSEGEQDPALFNLPQTLFTYNRKQKSLSQLTKKFIEKFEGATCPILALDQVTQQMNVQRRRIYDIINIMESLKVVSKIRKNLYRWKGLKEAIKTINIYSTGGVVQEDEDSSKVKKQKSLESLATQFLKIFSQNKASLTLEQASFYVMSQSCDDMKKTKVRRLYDIVNVFKCLGLVRKVKTCGSKPSYQWLGCDCLMKIVQQKQQISPTQASHYPLQEPDQFINSQFTQIETRIYDEGNKKPTVQEHNINQGNQISQNIDHKNLIQQLLQVNNQANDSKKCQQTTSTLSVGSMASPRQNQRNFLINKQKRSRARYSSQINKILPDLHFSRAKSHQAIEQSKQIQDDNRVKLTTNKRRSFNYVQKKIYQKDQSYFSTLMRVYQQNGVKTLEQIISTFNENLWECQNKKKRRNQNQSMQNNIMSQ